MIPSKLDIEMSIIGEVAILAEPPRCGHSCTKVADLIDLFVIVTRVTDLHSKGKVRELEL